MSHSASAWRPVTRERLKTGRRPSGGDVFSKRMDRRSFVRIALCGAAAAAAPGSGSGQSLPASLTVQREAEGRRVPASYVGLSYELAQLTEPTFFSPEHTDLISLFRALSPGGLLRLGGNTSEFCWFQAEPSTPAPKLHVPPGDLARNWMPHRLFALQPEAIHALAGFLHATGWQAIYGLNFGNSTPERAAVEAAYVAHTLGDRLAFFQIGNEPDFYRDANNGTRPPGWGFDDYAREWIAFAHAITAAVPTARFGGPDTGASSDWIVRFGREIAPVLEGRLVALSGHYYAEGPPNDPAVTTRRLLAGDPQVTRATKAIVQVADANHLAYHMTEGNSCYRGGKPGMSDAFAAALWSGDFLLRLASLGCAGVNLHGGDSRFLSAGLGDHNPGLDVPGATRPAAPNGFYTPIASERGSPARARPVFYGMLLAQQFAGATMLQTDLTAQGNVTAYAARKEDRYLVAIFNKDETASFDLEIGLPGSARNAAMWRLTAPDLKSTEGITLGDAAVPDDGPWTPSSQRLPVLQGRARLQLPSGTGALVLSCVSEELWQRLDSGVDQLAAN